MKKGKEFFLKNQCFDINAAVASNDRCVNLEKIVTRLNINDSHVIKGWPVGIAVP